jgi:hypothetical protein
MDAWTLDRYRRPQLAHDVSVNVTEDVIELVRGDDRRTIRFDTGSMAGDLASGLEALRDPRHANWELIVGGSPEPSWRSLATHLDEWSFLEEAEAENPSDVLAGLAVDVAKCVSAAVAHTHTRMPADNRFNAPEEARRWLALLKEDGREAGGAWNDDNFFRAIGRLSIARLRQAHLIAFMAVERFLEVVGQRASIGDDWKESLGAGLSLSEMRSHVSAVADFFIRSLSEEANRRCLPASASAKPMSGAGFVLLSERAMRSHARDLGEGKFQRAWAAMLAANDPLVVGCHVEEYHVTRRFVEMITPLMAVDLDSPLRSLIYRYFAEEVGHESFEAATCAAFGVDAHSLDEACPLPLHVAFVDVFTMLAKRGVVDFLAAVSITEGMLGESSPINARVDSLLPTSSDARDVYHRHEELNLELNHASIPRLALELVPTIGVIEQQRALDALSLIFELNFRAWEALLDFYGAQSSLQLPRPFDAAFGERAKRPAA